MDKRPEKMTNQGDLLEMQGRVAGRSKVFDILTIITFLAIIYFLAVAMYVLPDSGFSEQENRVLQQRPSMSSRFDGGFVERVRQGKFLDYLFDGSFTADIAKYYADQFPFRDVFVGMKGVAEIALLKKENDDVVLARDGYIIKRGDYPDMEIISSNIGSIMNLSNACDRIGIPFYLAIAGRPVDVLEQYLPSTFPNDLSDELWAAVSEMAGEYVNLLDPIKEQAKNGKQVYYRTDHHWTTLGAYHAYHEIIQAIGGKPQPIYNFTIEEMTDGFYGTTWSSAGMKWVRPDTIEYFRYRYDGDFVTEIVDTGTDFVGFYDLEYLDGRDKYGSFLSGNNSRVNISSADNRGRRKMLIIKDSFANSVAPFLAYHYDLVIIDPRFYRDSLIRLVVDEQIDMVLVLNYMGSLTEGNVYGILNYGVDEEYLAEVEQGKKRQAELSATPQYRIKNIYVNGNDIGGYSIAIPDVDGGGYREAAEYLQEKISTGTGMMLEIITIEGGASYDGAIILSDVMSGVTPDDGPSEGTPLYGGVVRFATEGDNLVISCSTEDGIAYGVRRFVDLYIARATGSFNFSGDYVYIDIYLPDDAAVIMPE